MNAASGFGQSGINKILESRQAGLNLVYQLFKPVYGARFKLKSFMRFVAGETDYGAQLIKLLLNFFQRVAARRVRKARKADRNG